MYVYIYIYIIQKYLDLQTDNVFDHVGKQQKQNGHIFSPSYSLTLSQVYMNFIALMMMIRKLCFKKISHNTTNITNKTTHYTELTTISVTKRLISALKPHKIGLWNPPFSAGHWRSFSGENYGHFGCYINIWMLYKYKYFMGILYKYLGSVSLRCGSFFRICVFNETQKRFHIGWTWGTWDASNGDERATSHKDDPCLVGGEGRMKGRMKGWILGYPLVI